MNYLLVIYYLTLGWGTSLHPQITHEKFETLDQCEFIGNLSADKLNLPREVPKRYSEYRDANISCVNLKTKQEKVIYTLPKKS